MAVYVTQDSYMLYWIPCFSGLSSIIYSEYMFEWVTVFYYIWFIAELKFYISITIGLLKIFVIVLLSDVT
jgi:hypothetical protein